MTGGSALILPISCPSWSHYLHPTALFGACGGRTLCSPSTGNQVISLASGPLAGIASLFCLLIASQVAQSVLKGKTVKEGVYAGLLKPFTICPEVAKKVENMIVKVGDMIGQEDFKPTSFQDIYFFTFAALTSMDIFSQFLEGFSPLALMGSDSYKLWTQMGFNPVGVGAITFAGIVVAPALLSIAKGLYDGAIKVYTKNWE